MMVIDLITTINRKQLRITYSFYMIYNICDILVGYLAKIYLYMHMIKEPDFIKLMILVNLIVT